MTFNFKKNGEKSIHDLGGASPILVFALGWDSKGKAGILGKIIGAKHQADLDLSCAVYDGNNDRIDCVWYAQLRSKDGAIRHKGDDTVGEETGDDETVILDMNQLDEEVQTLFFVVSCFSGENMSKVEKAYWRLFDAQTRARDCAF
jgi:tellurium resistance protein TerZ